MSRGGLDARQPDAGVGLVAAHHADHVSRPHAGRQSPQTRLGRTARLPGLVGSPGSRRRGARPPGSRAASPGRAGKIDNVDVSGLTVGVFGDTPAMTVEGS